MHDTKQLLRKRLKPICLNWVTKWPGRVCCVWPNGSWASVGMFEHLKLCVCLIRAYTFDFDMNDNYGGSVQLYTHHRFSSWCMFRLDGCVVSAIILVCQQCLWNVVKQVKQIKMAQSPAIRGEQLNWTLSIDKSMALYYSFISKLSTVSGLICLRAILLPLL